MTAAILLAILLYEPGAPTLPQRLHRAFIVGQACAAEGLAPVECVATAWVESRFKPEARSKAGAVGMMQVLGKGASADLHRNAAQGARKLAACREEFGALRWRCYACSPDGARRGAPGCLRHERRVRETLERIGWLLRLAGGDA